MSMRTWNDGDGVGGGGGEGEPSYLMEHTAMCSRVVYGILIVREF